MPGTLPSRGCKKKPLEPALNSCDPLLPTPYSQRWVPSWPGERAAGLGLLPGGLQAVPAGVLGSLGGGGFLLGAGRSLSPGPVEPETLLRAVGGSRARRPPLCPAHALSVSLSVSVSLSQLPASFL